MKESLNRYINPFLSDEENDKVNFTTNLDNGKFEKSLEPSSVPSESVEKDKEVYIDKNVTECQLPETMICYEETGFNVIKDICVDEGLSNGEIIKCDKEHHELPCNPIILNGDKHEYMIEDDLDTQLITAPLEDSYKNTCLFSVTIDDNVPSNGAADHIKAFAESNVGDSSENFGPDNSMQNGEQKLDSSAGSLDNSIRVLEPTNNGVDDVDQQFSEINGSEVNEPRQTNHTIDTPNEIMEENTTLDSDNVEPTTASGPHELPPNTQGTLNHQETSSSNITVMARGGGESSFSRAGHVSGHITYSGPVTAFGNISHRSDGSNSSVRSFAFPILQNEWNYSPVRMAKADLKQSRKHRGWRQALVCCRF